MIEVFGENGILSSLNGRFEPREEQTRMADFILEALCDGEGCFVEAGTGVGKTLAYLVPAISHCLENGKRLWVSTETRALQKQLLEKDIPVAREIIKRLVGREFRYELCMGSANYPCRRRFESLLERGEFHRVELHWLEELRGLFDRGGPLSRFDTRMPQSLWSRVSRESEACDMSTCAFASHCAFQLARRRWQQADVLILNHYLFFTNVNSGRTYLPAADVVVFDEAHSIEDVASEQLGFSVSFSDMMEIAERFHRRGRRKTILSRIGRESLRKKALGGHEALFAELQRFFESLRDLLPAGRLSHRLKEPPGIGAEMMTAYRGFYALLDDIYEQMDDDESRAEFEIARSRLFSAVQALSSAIACEDSDWVYWLERGETELLGEVTVKGQPIDIAEIMEREVLAQYESVVYVSATLAVNGDFSYIAGRLGSREHRSLLLRSPFDFKKQAVLLLNREEGGPDGDSFAGDAARIAAQIIEHLNGNCLMLFTSYRMLEIVRESLAGMIDHPVFAQGEYPASEVLERYLEAGNAVLMGTHSFWQGIDLPGDLLRGVIMMRLPFAVPDRPPVQARMERIEERGGNPFYSFQVPAAVLKFKQGFGRLIRGKTDRGVVAVLDSRILGKGYGRFFIKSLPECSIAYSVPEMKRLFQAVPTAGGKSDET